jgi:hypothetical protein
VAPVHKLRFSPNGTFLASYSTDGRLVFSRAENGVPFIPVGYANVAEEALDFKWGAEGTLFLSLSSCEIVRLEVPETAHKARNLLYDTEALKRASFNVEEPVLSFEIVPAMKGSGTNEALLVGMTADKCIRHYSVPEGTEGWTGPGGKAKAPVFERSAHAKPGSAIGKGCL